MITMYFKSVKKVQVSNKKIIYKPAVHFQNEITHAGNDLKMNGENTSDKVYEQY